LWDLFQFKPIDDEAKDLVIKIFMATLYDTTRIWYDGLPDKIINTIDQFEEIFMNIWGIEEDPGMLCDIKGE